MIRTLLLLAATGCAIEEKVREPDLTCAGEPNPSTAPERVTVNGIVKDLQGQDFLGGVAIQPFSSGLALNPITSDSAGRFTFSHETAGVPNNDSVQAMKDGFLQTLAFPSKPVAGDADVEVRMIRPEELSGISDQLALDPMKAIVFVQATDCNLSGLEGATVSSSPPGTVLFFEFVMPSMRTTTDPSGIAMIVNLPTGDVTISGELNGMQLRPHVVQATLGAFVITQLQP